jgi:hypothetical protein
MSETYHGNILVVVFFGSVLHCTNTVEVKWHFSSFISEGKTWFPLHAIFKG